MEFPKPSEYGIPDSIERILRQYAVNSAYLFGSRADGTATPESDYDIGLVFENYDPSIHTGLFASRLEVEFAEAIGNDVDLTFLQGAPIELCFSVIRDGKLIYCSDHDARTDFEDVVIRDYLDFQPFLEQYYREMRESVKEGAFYTQRPIHQ